MQCVQCGAALPPGSGFCGACGRQQPQAQPAGYPPQGYAQPPLGYAQPPQGYAQPPQGYAQPPQAYAQPPQGYAQPPQGFAQASQPAYAPSAPLQPYPIIMQQRLTRLTGQLFVAPTRLYFICESQKGGMAVAMGKAVGGLIGGAIVAFGAPTPGQAAPVIDEPALQRALHERAGSLVMEPQQIKAIKDTFWTHAIWFNGKTYALPERLHKELRPVLGQWCQANSVKHAGLLPKA